MQTIQQEPASQHAQQLQLQFLTTHLLTTSVRNVWEYVQTVLSLKSLNISVYHNVQIPQWRYSFTTWTPAVSPDVQKDSMQIQAAKSALRSVPQTQTYSPWKSTIHVSHNALLVCTRIQAPEDALIGAPKPPFSTLTTRQTSVLIYVRPHPIIMVWIGSMEIRFVSWLVV